MDSLAASPSPRRRNPPRQARASRGLVQGRRNATRAAKLVRSIESPGPWRLVGWGYGGGSGGRRGGGSGSSSGAEGLGTVGGRDLNAQTVPEGSMGLETSLVMTDAFKKTEGETAKKECMDGEGEPSSVLLSGCKTPVPRHPSPSPPKKVSASRERNSSAYNELRLGDVAEREERSETKASKEVMERIRRNTGALPQITDGGCRENDVMAKWKRMSTDGCSTRAEQMMSSVSDRQQSKSVWPTAPEGFPGVPRARSESMGMASTTCLPVDMKNIGEEKKYTIGPRETEHGLEKVVTSTSTSTVAEDATGHIIKSEDVPKKEEDEEKWEIDELQRDFEMEFYQNLMSLADQCVASIDVHITPYKRRGRRDFEFSPHSRAEHREAEILPQRYLERSPPRAVDVAVPALPQSNIFPPGWRQILKAENRGGEIAEFLARGVRSGTVLREYPVGHDVRGVIVIDDDE